MIKLNNISKKYEGFALRNISFSIEKGEYVVLLGESGAGKSLILEMIAGMLQPDSGEIFLGPRNITREKIQKRNMGMVFQDNTVFPHLKVKNNIAFPLKNKKLDAQTVQQIVLDLAQKTRVDHLLDRWPETLSGGELQRVVISRTLASNPVCLLLDEPLASLDVQLRDDMRRLLRQLNEEGMAMIHVTHDFEEAISLADKIGIVHQGELVQFGRPKEIFHKPKSKFIAKFSGIKNFYNSMVVDDKTLLLENKIELKLPHGLSKGQGFAMFKSEDVILSTSQIDSSIINNFEGKVIEIIPSHRGMEIIVDVGIIVSTLISQESFDRFHIAKHGLLWIGIKATAIHFIEKE